MSEPDCCGCLMEKIRDELYLCWYCGYQLGCDTADAMLEARTLKPE